MGSKLTAPRFNFSVEKDDPFLISASLKEIAEKEVGAKNMIDLSRGDPGYQFSPSERGRRFFSYLVFLDSFLNNSKRRFSETKPADFPKIWKEIVTITQENFSPAQIAQFQKDWKEFFRKVIKLSEEQGLNYSKYDILAQFFTNSIISGGCYGKPAGEEMIRAIIAWWHQKTLAQKITGEDIILTKGASDAITTLFKLLGEEGLGYLKKGDQVLLPSPAYEPYGQIFFNRGFKVLPLRQNYETGEIEKDSLKQLTRFQGKIKVIIMTNPSNPSGFCFKEEDLKAISDFAQRKNSLIISDEVYSSFFPRHKTIIDFCPERVIRIGACSKIERSAGLRSGDILITKKGNQYISSKILKNYLKKKHDFKTVFILAKTSGGIKGELHRNIFVSTPAQFLEAGEIILGAEERFKFRLALKQNRDIFYQILGLPHQGNFYYFIFDFNRVEGCKKQKVPAEKKLIELAKRGVVYLPACRFFNEEEQKSKDLKNTVRVSLANASVEKFKKAAEVTKKYLCSKSK